MLVPPCALSESVMPVVASRLHWPLSSRSLASICLSRTRFLPVRACGPLPPWPRLWYLGEGLRPYPETSYSSLIRYSQFPRFPLLPFLLLSLSRVALLVTQEGYYRWAVLSEMPVVGIRTSTVICSGGTVLAIGQPPRALWGSELESRS